MHKKLLLSVDSFSVSLFIDCSSAPCKNGGTCRNSGDSFICSCVLGFEGKTCRKGEIGFSLYRFTNVLLTTMRTKYVTRLQRRCLSERNTIASPR